MTDELSNATQGYALLHLSLQEICHLYISFIFNIVKELHCLRRKFSLTPHQLRSNFLMMQRISLLVYTDSQMYKLTLSNEKKKKKKRKSIVYFSNILVDNCRPNSHLLNATNGFRAITNKFVDSHPRPPQKIWPAQIFFILL